MEQNARITPAWAGKRRLSDGTKWCGRDHPRVGGEKTLLIKEADSVQGSPPRGRGKGMTFKQVMDRDGITPAWAGKRQKITPF